MGHASFASDRVVRLLNGLPVLALALVQVPAGAAAGPNAASLCAMLKEQIPQIRTFTPEVARAQLVIALSEKVETNQQLQQAMAEIDRATSTGCPGDREAMLKIVKTKTLADALR